MTTTLEGNRINDVLKKELSGFSRDKVTVLAGSGSARVLLVGQVLGSVLGSLVVASRPSTGNTGDGAVGAVTLKPGAQPGVYVLRLHTASANAGDFSVTAPDGSVLPDLTVAVAYLTDHFGVTIADGATDFIVGDTVLLIVSGSRKVVALDLNGLDGSEKTVGVLAEDVTAPDGTDADGVAITRNAWVAQQELIFPGSISDAERDAVIADLKTNGIVIAQNAA